MRDPRYPDGIAPVQRRKESRAFAYAGWVVAAVAVGVIIIGYLWAINLRLY